ncbi:MAG TPA: threonine synthase [Alphaproteobacteria bacterium]|nr:threonine synthase [Alphaproteobacteria bacterium]
MRYISTRGQAPALAFDDVLLAGLARDGGLYVPEAWPSFSLAELKALGGLDYGELARRVMLPFLGGTIAEADFAKLVDEAYAGFDDKAIVPLKQLGQGEWLMELFHGPTLAFKDIALQLVGRLFDHVLERRGERITIVGATSGDTGSAAIEACKERTTIDIFILHPHGRVSEMQRRQMTTVAAENVWNIAIEGSFDDCQDLVKGMFNDPPFREELRLAAVNSINWARIMAQIPYYIWAALALGGLERPLAFAVPTGNFGNVYAAYAARAMGLPIAQLIVGSNRNDILTRFFATGVMELRAVEPSLSPSMDIQVSSNFERLLFDLLDRDGQRVAAALARLRNEGRFALAAAEWQKALPLFAGARLDDAATIRAIREVYRETGELLDPHSVIGLMAGRRLRKDSSTPLVALATAHPAKFPDAIAAAIGKPPPIPARLRALAGLEEKYTVLPNSLSEVEGFVREALAMRGTR